MNPEHVTVVRQGQRVIAEWYSNHPKAVLDLSMAELTTADLNGAKLSWANMIMTELNGAKLNQTDLNWARLNKANLIRADLTEADLTMANLTGADLTRADLAGAKLNATDLTRTILIGAKLSGTDFTRANCNDTIFGDVNLSHVIALETVQHSGPSTLGVDTLYRSGGKIPEVFLRGCGIPEEFITYLPSLIGAQQAIQFYSCFISYSHKDEAFTQRLHGRLQQAGLRVWYAPEDMKGGRKLHTQIEEGIRLHDKLLLVLSEESLASEWVATEIRKARKAERQEKRQKLFPIRLVPFDPYLKDWECFDADSGKDLGVELREYFIPDFEHWKDHDTFEAGMVRLLKDLRAGEASPGLPS